MYMIIICEYHFIIFFDDRFNLVSRIFGWKCPSNNTGMGGKLYHVKPNRIGFLSWLLAGLINIWFNTIFSVIHTSIHLFQRQLCLELRTYHLKENCVLSLRQKTKENNVLHSNHLIEKLYFFRDVTLFSWLHICTIKGATTGIRGFLGEHEAMTDLWTQGVWWRPI